MAAPATKIKSKAAEFAPQTREEVAAAIEKIGIAQRERDRIQADMNDRLATIKKEFEEKAKPHGEEIESLSKGVQAWCESNRDDLTKKGKTKTATFTTGEVSWRATPPRVVLKAIDKVLEALKTFKLKQFIRTKEEVNKEAILEANTLAAANGPDEKNPEVIKAAKAMKVLENIKGIQIAKDEDFVITPFEAELEKVN